MHTTNLSLLERLRRPGEHQAWDRFVALYAPLLCQWARRLGVPEDDVADLVQDVFTLLLQKMPAFQYDQQKRFRGWLWTVTRNVWYTQHRRAVVPLAAGDGPLAELAVPDPAEEVDEAEYRQYLVRRALQLIKAEFQPVTWQAFQDGLLSGDPAATVAARLGLSVDAVYAAKARVLRRLRKELAGLLE